MRVHFFVFLFLVSGSIFGKTTFINTDKLPVSKENGVHLQFVRVNEKYVDHISPQWNYNIGKAVVVEGLKAALKNFSSQDASNLEVNLLLGDISSYLNNLNGSEFLDSAMIYYKKATQLDPLDYRPFWFLGHLYASINDYVRAIPYFKMAQSRLPKTEPAEFWEQFAHAAYQADMPTTSVFAMDKARGLLGYPCEFERMSGQSVRSKILEVNSNRTYTNKELWSYKEGDVIEFSSRPLGMKVEVEPEWELVLSPFQNKTATFTAFPQVVEAEDQEAKFSMTITAKLATEDENVRSFLSNLLPSATKKVEFDYSNKYPNTVAYEIVDPEKNKEKGGMHQYVIGVKRKNPLYAGISLEEPQGHSEKESSDSENKRMETAKSRFTGPILYAIVLESNEAIFPAAKRVFWDFFVNHLFLE